MEATRKRVLKEVFFPTSVVAPTALGLLASLIGWLGGIQILTTLGILGVLGGLGWMAIRAVFRADVITEKVLQRIKREALAAEEVKLDALARKILFDEDYRTKDAFKRLRSLKQEFEETADQPGVERRSAEIVGQVRQLFSAAVKQLERSYELFLQIDRLAGESQEPVKAEREKIVADILASVDKLQSVTNEYRELMRQDVEVDLTHLRNDLDISLRVAKRTEERMKELEEKPDYESYLKE